MLQWEMQSEDVMGDIKHEDDKDRGSRSKHSGRITGRMTEDDVVSRRVKENLRIVSLALFVRCQNARRYEGKLVNPGAKVPVAC